MQIVIPMSGFGERFRRAGYTVPKPLITVDERPIISYVLDMFPDETNVVFICNEEHLAEPEYRMSEILRTLCPTGTIVPVKPHKLGPVNAVLAARDSIDLSSPTIVNYCDFTCYWNYTDFKKFIKQTDCDGCIPAYKGFHPHSLGSTFYAYVKHTDLWMDAIQEKQPWTDNPTEEYASSGTYYFRSGELCLSAFEEQMRQNLHVNNEYYVSLAYQILQERNLNTAIYELQHFMQWGTPKDLEEYISWSNVFRRLATDEARRPHQRGTVMVPMAGLGKRFADAGYSLTKPMIPVSGRPMVIQATRDLPEAPKTKFVLRKDMDGLNEIVGKLETSWVGTEITLIDGLTDGQAVTCQLGLEGINLDEPLTIGACDNGLLYDAREFEGLMQPSGPDVLVWVVRGHVDGKLRPEMFGWVDCDESGKITSVQVKSAPKDPETAAMIVGTFTFRQADFFQQAMASLKARNGRVNNEYYVDSLIQDAVDAGLDCRVFEVEKYIGWGTPNDLMTFSYWQSCFHKWESHPYSVAKDKRIPSSRVNGLSDEYAYKSPPLPRPFHPASETTSEGSTIPALLKLAPFERALRELVRFVPIGVAAVIVDYLVYVALINFGAQPFLAKPSSFACGGLVAFFGNRYFTFKRKSGRYGTTVFALLYGLTLGLNTVANSLALDFLSGTPGDLHLAFIVATALSATVNFLGMKLAVFTGKPS